METLYVQSGNWIVADSAFESDIRCWGLDKDSNPNCLIIKGFPLFFYLQLPKKTNKGREIAWNKSKVYSFMERVNFFLGENKPVSFSLEYNNELYYYQGNNRHPMVLMVFSNMPSMKSAMYFFNKPVNITNLYLGYVKCDVWHYEVSSARKLLSLKNLAWTQWFTCEGSLVPLEEKITTIEREYEVNWNSIVGIPKEETVMWITHPCILSVDIECYSDTRGMPDEKNHKHVAYMISCVKKRYKKEGTYERYGIVIGECDTIPQEKLENNTIIRVNDEIELGEAFQKVVYLTDPDIFVGHNIFNFDYAYLDFRFKRKLKTWPCMGRLIGQTSSITTVELKTNQHGYQSAKILNMEGRISLDLLPIMSKDHKLDKYTLDFISKKFIGKTKHDVKPQEMFAIYEEVVKATKEYKAYVNNPEAYCRETIRNNLMQARSKMGKVMEYCIQDSELVIELLEKLSIWESVTEMAGVVGQNIEDLYIKGQRTRCLSMLYDIATKNNYVMTKRNDETKAYSYVGGYVAPTIPGLEEDVLCMDFASLYPSIMEAYNICFTTLVRDDSVPDSECNVVGFKQKERIHTDDRKAPKFYDPLEDSDDEEEEEEPKKKSVKKSDILYEKKEYKFRFYKHKKGLLPKLVNRLIGERRAVIKIMDNTKANIKVLENKEIIILLLDAILAGEKIATLEESKAMLKKLEHVNVTPSAEEISEAKKRIYCANLLTPGYIAKEEYEEGIAVWYTEMNLDMLKKRREILKEEFFGKNIKEYIYSLKASCISLQARQLALKIAANSLYGFLGMNMEDIGFTLMEAAMSITAKGRELIKDVAKHIKTKYDGVLIAGDTDSVMVKLPTNLVSCSKDCWYWGTKIAEDFNGIEVGGTDCDGNVWPEGRASMYPPPIKLTFEKAMLFLTFCKKRYASYFIGKDGNFKTEAILDIQGNVVGVKKFLYTRGIVLAGRGNCELIKTVYEKILSIILDKGSFLDAITYLVSILKDLVTGKIDHNKLIMTRKVGANYISENAAMKLFSEHLRAQGIKINPGDRVSFLFILDPAEKHVGNRMRLIEKYEEMLENKTENEMVEQIDYMHYIEKVLQNPINQLLYTGFKKLIDASFNTYSYDGKTMEKPVTLLSRMIQHNVNIDILPIAVASILKQ
jgi:DNA polymerase elongation subunit (family B)